MKKLQKRKLILKYLLPMILWMCVIFAMSAQPADVSSQMSLGVGRKLGSLFVPGYSSLNSANQLLLAEQIDFAVRKSAHALEYAILAILVIRTLRQLAGSKKRAFTIFLESWLICAIYGASDEMHQLFVLGRSCQLRDVIVDSCGAFLGLVFYVCLLAVLHRLIKNWSNFNTKVSQSGG